MLILKRSLTWILLFFAVMAAAGALPTWGEGRRASPVMDAMQVELEREMKVLGKEPTPPYFLSYEITDDRTAGASASFGQLVGSNQTHHRQLDIDLRVGSRDFDSTHLLRGDGASGGGAGHSFLQMSLEDDPDAIRSLLWTYTDRDYKQALEQLTKARTNSEVKVEQEDKSADFSQEQAQKFSEPPVTLGVDRQAWEQKVRKYTVPFSKFGNIYEASASISADAQTRWFVNTEGAGIETSQAYYRLSIWASTRADDGMVLPRYESFYAATEEGLPDDATVLKAVEQMIKDLEALRSAPVVDPYTGPAILSGRASGVFFHEVFGHRIEGHRQKRVEEGQTFKKKVNEKILPESFSVFSDPTVHHVGQADLVG
ncbi:MAG TPA: metallopeptidase TldD-related protein, partial [Candidatus Methylomirabilis sp.]|nr:metallopeptidase TldD-related protein [Candidatus Methylomirabilis sp.]